VRLREAQFARRNPPLFVARGSEEVNYAEQMRFAHLQG
jgi:hypothetical protein